MMSWVKVLGALTCWGVSLVSAAQPNRSPEAYGDPAKGQFGDPAQGYFGDASRGEFRRYHRLSLGHPCRRADDVVAIGVLRQITGCTLLQRPEDDRAVGDRRSALESASRSTRRPSRTER